MKILQCVLFASLIIGVYQHPPNLISDPKDYPFFAMFIVKTPLTPTEYHSAICGATLIRPEWVLTAGHCLPDTEEQIDGFLRQPMNSIFMGSVHKPSKKYGQARKVIAVHRHPDFAVEYHPDNQGYRKKIRNDVAALKVNKPFKMTPTVAVVHLSKTTLDCKFGILLGIGTNWTESGNLTSVLHYTKVTLREYHPKNKRTAVFYTADEVLDEYEPNGTVYTFLHETGGPVLCDGLSNSIQIGVLSATIIPSNNTNSPINLVQRVDYLDAFIEKITTVSSPRASGSETCSVFNYFCLFFLCICILW